jgi:hypothetical protein
VSPNNIKIPVWKALIEISLALKETLKFIDVCTFPS